MARHRARHWDVRVITESAAREPRAAHRDINLEMHEAPLL